MNVSLLKPWWPALVSVLVCYVSLRLFEVPRASSHLLGACLLVFGATALRFAREADAQEMPLASAAFAFAWLTRYVVGQIVREDGALLSAERMGPTAFVLVSLLGAGVSVAASTGRISITSAAVPAVGFFLLASSPSLEDLRWRLGLFGLVFFGSAGLTKHREPPFLLVASAWTTVASAFVVWPGVFLQVALLASEFAQQNHKQDSGGSSLPLVARAASGPLVPPQQQQPRKNKTAVPARTIIPSEPAPLAPPVPPAPSVPPAAPQRAAPRIQKTTLRGQPRGFTLPQPKPVPRKAPGPLETASDGTPPAGDLDARSALSQRTASPPSPPPPAVLAPREEDEENMLHLLDEDEEES